MNEQRAIAPYQKGILFFQAMKICEKKFGNDWLKGQIKQLIGMTLNFAEHYELPIVYTVSIQHSARCVLGILEFGLRTISNDAEIAGQYLEKNGIVQIFRIGWTKCLEVAGVKKKAMDRALLSNEALEIAQQLELDPEKENWLGPQQLERYKENCEETITLQQYGSWLGEFSRRHSEMTVLGLRDEDTPLEKKSEASSILFTSLLLYDIPKEYLNLQEALSLIQFCRLQNLKILEKKFKQQSKQFLATVPREFQSLVQNDFQAAAENLKKIWKLVRRDKTVSAQYIVNQLAEREWLLIEATIEESARLFEETVRQMPREEVLQRLLEPRLEVEEQAILLKYLLPLREAELGMVFNNIEPEILQGQIDWSRYSWKTLSKIILEKGCEIGDEIGKDILLMKRPCQRWWQKIPVDMAIFLFNCTTDVVFLMKLLRNVRYKIDDAIRERLKEGEIVEDRFPLLFFIRPDDWYEILGMRPESHHWLSKLIEEGRGIFLSSEHIIQIFVLTERRWRSKAKSKEGKNFAHPDLDEPFNALDKKMQEAVLKELRKKRKR